MPLLRQRKNGYWRVDARDMGLGQISLRTRDRALAKDRFRDWLAEFGDFRPEQRDGTLGLAAEEYLADKRRYDSPKHAERVEGVLRFLIEDQGTDRRLSAITPGDLGQFIDRRRRGLAPASINKEITVIKAFFNWLSTRGDLADNPAGKLRRIKVPHKEAAFLTREEVHRLMEASPAKLVPVWKGLLLTAMRKSEFVALKVRDVRWEMNLLRVRSGKGRKSRWVPMTPEMRRLAESQAKGKQPDDPLFPEAHYEFTGLSRALRHCAAKAGLPPGVHLHTLRHTAVSHMLSRPDQNLFAVAKIAGHSIDVMVNTYGHLLPEVGQDHVAPLDELVVGQIVTRVAEKQPDNNRKEPDITVKPSANPADVTQEKRSPKNVSP